MKKKVTMIAAMFFLLLSAAVSVYLSSEQANASSASVHFTTDSQRVNIGDTFFVICTVSSSDRFYDVEMELLYDAELFEFIRGGAKVSGGGGALRISSVGNESSVKKRTFSLEFKALEKGSGRFELDKMVNITGTDGETFSVSANLATVTVLSDEEGGYTLEDENEANDPSAVTLNTNNKLKKLSFDCVSMKPGFEPDVLEYTVGVDCDTDVLYFYYTPANSKEKVRIKDNEGLVPGENLVKVVVTAESGDKRVYKIHVIKETEDETRVREQAEKGTSNITFSVYEKGGTVYIQNQYQFEVVSVEDDDIIPSGYVKTSVDLDGKSVPAYTMENDLDNNYLLMYLQGVGGEPTLYQYDRAEKTIQRYTGTMTQKVNQGGNVADEVEMVPDMWLYVMIVILMIIVLALLILILNMKLRERVGRGKRELDDMDF